MPVPEVERVPDVVPVALPQVEGVPLPLAPREGVGVGEGGVVIQAPNAPSFSYHRPSPGRCPRNSNLPSLLLRNHNARLELPKCHCFWGRPHWGH